MKSITIAGRLGRDAVLRNAGDSPVLNFAVAVDDRSGKEKQTLWFDVALWGKRGETLAQYLTKGTCVAVSGDLGRREHDGKTYLTVRADGVTLLGGGEKREESGGTSNGSFSQDLDDEIPF